MVASRKLKFRTPIKQRRIITSLRGEIVSGVFPPGCQLPTRTVLEEKYKASRVTVQRVLDQLVNDGFVYARGRNGTFVSDRPPHLFQYGLLFHHRPSPSGQWSRFWSALRNQAEQFNRKNRHKIKIYYGPEHAPDESFDELLNDIRSNRLAGLIFAAQPYIMKDTVAVTHPGLPRVAIMPSVEFEGVAAVDPSYESFFNRAFEYLLQEKRCQRPAILMGKHARPYLDQLERIIAERGVKIKPYWMQRMHPGMPEAARELTHLLFHSNQSERPDGLIIADDHLVEHACAGLLAAGVRVPDELQIVAHCNFPSPTPSAVPMRRLGFDAGLAFQYCIDSLEQQRQGRFPGQVRLIEARFEDEVNPVDAHAMLTSAGEPADH